MNSLRFRGKFDLELANLESFAAPLAPDHVDIQILSATICATDANIIRGLYPARLGVTLGHEAAGRVVACGAGVSGIDVGDVVVIDPTPSCEQCATCRRGLRNHCERKDGTEAGVSYDGAFATLFRTTAKQVRRLPPEFPVAAACLTEPLACVLNAVRQLRLNSTLDHAAVVGAGPIGVLFSHVLALHGLQGTLVDTSPARLELASQLAPSGWTTNASFREALADSGLRAFPLVVDACGAVDTAMVDGIARGGVLLLAGLRSSSLTIDPMVVTDRSLSLLGSIDSNGTFDEALNLVTSGRVPARAMVSRQYALSDFRAAFLAVGVDLDRRQYVPGPPVMKVAILPQEC